MVPTHKNLVPSLANLLHCLLQCLFHATTQRTPPPPTHSHTPCVVNSRQPSALIRLVLRCSKAKQCAERVVAMTICPWHGGISELSICCFMAHLGRRPHPTPLTQDRKAPTSAPTALPMVPALVSICLPMKPMLSVGETSLFAPTMNPARRSSAAQSLRALRSHPLRVAESSMSSRFTPPPGFPSWRAPGAPLQGRGAGK